MQSNAGMADRGRRVALSASLRPPVNNLAWLGRGIELYPHKLTPHYLMGCF